MANKVGGDLLSVRVCRRSGLVWDSRLGTRQETRMFRRYVGAKGSSPRLQWGRWEPPQASRGAGPLVLTQGWLQGPTRDIISPSQDTRLNIAGAPVSLTGAYRFWPKPSVGSGSVVCESICLPHYDVPRPGENVSGGHIVWSSPVYCRVGDTSVSDVNKDSPLGGDGRVF